MLRASLPFTRMPGLVTRGCFKFKNAKNVILSKKQSFNGSLAIARFARAGVTAAHCQTRSFASVALVEEPEFVCASNTAAKNSVLNRMWQHIETGEENAFYVVDTAAIEDRYDLWMKHLPYVKPYYAVKCNPDSRILSTLARLGTGFDCASQAEIADVLAAGVDASNIIYANPCKQPSHISFAANHGVDFMTFDGCDELTKMKKLHPNARTVLRLFVDDSHSQCPLGTKFGAVLNDIPTILRHAKAIGSNVVGVSFHVGSGCFNVSAYSEAVARARKAFDIGASLGFNFKILDIGGGFPGDDTAPISFDDIGKELNKSLSEHFPLSSGVKIISEPGRFFAAASHTLAVNVIARKLAPNSLAATAAASSPKKAAQGKRNMHAGVDPLYMYFVNDGLYGSFNCLLYDHAVVHPMALSAQEADGEYSSSIWGPTCDGLDCIAKDIKMPVMDIGDWMYFANMGAYTSAAGSHFNGFVPPQKVYFDSKDDESA
ncbi:ornithine decarboxylase 1 [Thraustotheca clavata]|uniref:ornithine decarboxylase n=1 Tax=Thraustotheca clavata TaxID=74557 RepID=A0A1W0A664_9STRA|nr:ornithine decarboxylase 1 [Thraustotheca clavata]